MTEPENNITPFEEVPGAPPPDKPKLYSKRVIRVFSILFSTLAGGILLRQNLKDVGNERQGNYALIFSILFTMLIIVVVNHFFLKQAGIAAIFCNVIGSAVLNEYFYQKYIPDMDSYEKKPFWKPLIIWMVIVIAFVFILIAGGGLDKQ
jgi:mRNA-degrading endonuclease RelE of RelBE toxin-antitoxin system